MTHTTDSVAESATSDGDDIVMAIAAWFTDAARPLPWRDASCSPWGVMVSEFMLQQTPTSRVIEPWHAWMERWPTPAALAPEPVGEAIRQWGRLGYPRRAQRLHAAARAIVDNHGGEVPHTRAELLALPGVGDYTAAAIASFAFGESEVVLDTNVRRVLARAVQGVEYPPNSVTVAEKALGEQMMPTQGPVSAAEWAAASMELGALVCTARSPACERCPIRDRCAWVAAGRPAHEGPPRRGQTYAGTDRQVRGRILAVLREAPGAVPVDRIDSVWPHDTQRERSLESLLRDGLVVRTPDGLALPH